MTDRVMPHDLCAERAVLGAILLRQDVIYDVADVVGADDFWRDAHRRIFRHMRALAEAKTAIDFVPLHASLARAGELDEVGGPAYLTGLVDGVPHATNAVAYAHVVREKAARRHVIHAAQRAIAEAFESEEAIADVLERAHAAFFQVADLTRTGGFVEIKALMTDAIDTVEKLVADKRVVTGVPTGFVDLDDMTRGLQPGDLVIVAARPSMGKTSFAMNVVEHAALKAGRRVAVFSLEMGRKALALRMLSSEGRVDHHRLLNGHLVDADWSRIAAAMGRLADAPIHIDDSSTATVFDVRAKTRRLKADKGLELVVVDYLQLMTGTKAENKNLEVAAITKGLKAIARDLEVPVMLLSQLSREPEKRGNHRPQLSDLRDSGSIEQDADVVIMLHREEQYGATPQNRGEAEAILRKQRNGPTGTVRLTFRDHLVRFDNADHRTAGAGYAEAAS